MKQRFIALVLLLTLLLSLTGCSDVVNEIAGNVADAAVKELEAQIKSALETYSVEVVEIKSALGKLNNDAPSDLQFYCGVLVRSNSDKFPTAGAEALDKVFEQSGCQAQHESQISSELLTNQTISFKHSDFSTGDYYLIWIYSGSFTEKLSEIELPTFPANWLPGDGAKESASGNG